MTSLERHRLRARLTRGQLAERSGVSYGAIRSAEIGETALKDENLFRIADVLNVDPVDLRCELDADPKAAA